MPPSRISPLPVAALAAGSLVLGVFAAVTDAQGAGPKTPPRLPAPVPFACLAPSAAAPAPEAVPQDLLDAFGVLRRPITSDDALPETALKALRARGLEPFDPAAARLLRTTADGGRAWVVPVRDAAAPAGALLCRAPAPGRPARKRPAAQPGLAVVALGGTPAGGGGTLADLVRGRSPVTSDACSGTGGDMLTVSGIVPDGAAAAFLTATDGTAVRADVQDNGYAFVVPRPAKTQQRYVVWTGGDGTPHVQPLLAVALPPRVACRRLPATVPQISPSPGCGSVSFVVPPRPARPAPARPISRARRLAVPAPNPVPARPRPTAVPAPVTAACAVDMRPAIAVPLPAPIPARRP